ncbi:MAG TPA: CHAD domain-containing protein [Mucilaginibacter sp.]|jgi:CHAD domain-containing protein|nr:CHAD domain-containing protein [Mucilaginibacter sp.]
MKKKEEVKYLEKEWKDLDAHLKAFLESGDQEELHQFRVQTKKLRAMLNLLEHASRRHGLLEEFKPVRKMFKYAGHIRDAHTNLELSSRYALKNESFEAGQQRIIEEGTNEFREQAKKYTKKIDDAYKQLKRQLPHVDNSSIAEFYKKQLEQIANNLETPRFTEDMHTNRKLIKILVYNRKLADKALNGSFTFNMAYLDQLQNSLGEWHDNIVAAELFSSPEVNDKPVATLIKKKNNNVKRRIRTLANDFMKKATTAQAVAK